MTETKLIGFKTDADLRSRLERMAAANDRTLSHEIRHIIRKALESFEADQAATR